MRNAEVYEYDITCRLSPSLHPHSKLGSPPISPLLQEHIQPTFLQYPKTRGKAYYARVPVLKSVETFQLKPFKAIKGGVRLWNCCMVANNESITYTPYYCTNNRSIRFFAASLLPPCIHLSTSNEDQALIFVQPFTFQPTVGSTHPYFSPLIQETGKE